MSRNRSLWLAACAGLVSALLLVLPFRFSAIAAAALGFLAGYLLCKGFSVKEPHGTSALPAQNGNPPPANTSGEIFALGRLFDATLGGMREGLLVVNSDMRVVASNPAAHRLFNLPEGKLESRRLTT